MTKEHYIGLMSGTSLDAVDGALVTFNENENENENENDKKIELLTTASNPLTHPLKADLLALSQHDHASIRQLGKLDILLGNHFAECANNLLEKSGLCATDITAIGSHGQTVCHCPNEDVPFTLQIGDPNIVTKLTGITTVADFRRRDMAYGGQAAPLSPAFHRYLFQTPTHNRLVVNIGGMANLTFLPKEKDLPVTGFDTGPGNILLDSWCHAHTGEAFDRNGEWAAGGNLLPNLLEKLLEDPYFSAPPPKSTGRETFHLDWLQGHTLPLNQAQDVQTTLTELTAASIAKGILDTHAKPCGVYVCGGGANNGYLMKRIRANLPQHTVQTTEALGLHPQWVEAVTFAWLARQTLRHEPGNLPSVTGATQHTVLGAIYPFGRYVN